ncbi:unnamed protein product [Victoria cruziana]
MPPIRPTSLLYFLPCFQSRKKFCMLHVCNLWESKSRLFHSFRSPDSPSLASILRDVEELKSLQQIHANVIISGLQQNVFLSNRLLHAYFSCRDSTTAEEIFRRMTYRNVVSWTIMVNGYWKHRCPFDSVSAFHEMVTAGVLPNSVTIASVLPACCDMGLSKAGKSIHCYMIVHGYKANVYVDTAILDMYMKCDSLEDAFNVFDRMSERNVVSWNAMINGYVQVGELQGAIKMFKKMKHAGISIDNFTISILLRICAEMGCLIQGTSIHAHVIKYGFQNSSHVGTLMMDMYRKCGNVEGASQVFDLLPCKDVVSWSTILSIFSDIGDGDRAIELLDEMLASGITFDSVSMMEYLSLCSRLGALSRGECLHGLMTKIGLETGALAGTALINMYSKCGNLSSARSYFDQMDRKDVVSWNAMITGCGINGCGDEAIDLFWRMKSLGFQPNQSTFMSILSACSHARLVEQGLEVFEHMVEESSLVPDMQHYACIIDLLGRAGHLHAAYQLVKSLSLEHDVDVLGVLLGACKVYGETAIGAEISGKFFELDPSDAGCYVLLSNWYAGLKDWNKVEMVQDLLRLKGLKKEPGCSMIEIGGSFHAFFSDEKYLEN